MCLSFIHFDSLQTISRKNNPSPGQKGQSYTSGQLKHRPSFVLLFCARMRLGQKMTGQKMGIRIVTSSHSFWQHMECLGYFGRFSTNNDKKIRLFLQLMMSVAYVNLMRYGIATRTFVFVDHIIDICRQKELQEVLYNFWLHKYIFDLNATPMWRWINIREGHYCFEWVVQINFWTVSFII